MRKLFILLGIMVISLVLVGCNGENTVTTPPTYTGIRVEETNPVDGTDFVTFYRAKQEEVLVEVGLNNPDNLTIKSVVVNGITYNSHRFTEESTFSTIFFTVNVGSDLGATEYSVDRISYLDEEDTFTIEGFSNNQFEIYVYKELPVVERENYSSDKDSISVDFTIGDTDSVIDTSTLKAILYSGDALIEEVALLIGANTVLFENLNASADYDVKVVASYDLDDGNGSQQNVTLYEETYVTLSNNVPVADITVTDETPNSITFDVEIVDTDNTITSLEVQLFNGDDRVLGDDYTITLDGSNTSNTFDGLLNANEYTIRVVADYDLNTEGELFENRTLDYYTFTTENRSVPLPVISGLSLLENSIEFSVEIDDPLGIIIEDTLEAKLIIDGNLVDSALVKDNTVDMFFSELFADSDIRIEFYGDYYLNDGGITYTDEFIEGFDYSTNINEIPSVLINELIVEQGYVTLRFNASDPNMTLTQDFEIVLYEEDTEKGRTTFDVDDTEIVFDYPTVSGLNYYIEINASYDLRDGYGRQTETINQINSYSEEDKAPVAEVYDEIITTESISFKVDIIDADETIVPGTIVAYLMYNGVEHDSDDTLVVGVDQTVTFDEEILSDNDYEIVIKTSYDIELKEEIDNIVGEQINVEKTVSTLPKELPEVILLDETTDTESITFTFLIDDTYGVLIEDTVYATLYYQGNPVHTLLLDEVENYDVTFYNAHLDYDILSNSAYLVEITADYNLNDGTDTEAILLQEFNITTEAKATPTAVFNSTDSDRNSITVDINVEDPDGVIEDGTLWAVLVEEGVQNDATKQPLVVGLNSGITFSGLYSDEDYYVRVIADHNYNDGVVRDPGEKINEERITTEAYPNLSLDVDIVRATSNTFEIDLDISDPSSVYVENLEAVAYLDDVAVASTPFGFGAGQTIIISGLDSDTEYRIVIEADVNLETREQEIDDYELYSTYMFTEQATPPEENLVAFTSEDIFEKTASFDIEIDDDEGYLESFITATLKQYNGETIDSFIIAPNTTTEIDLFNLLSNNDYILELTADYNPGTGTETYTYTYEFTTLALEVPDVTVHEVATWVSSPDLTVSIDIAPDTDLVANDTGWTAYLYEDGAAVAVSTVDIDVVAGGNPEGGTTVVTFAGYDHTSGPSYTVVVTAMIQLNELDAADPDYEAETETIVGSRTYINAGN